MAKEPVTGEPRDVVVRVRVRAEERERWKEAARREDMSLSDWLRRLANDAAAPEAPIVVTEEDRALARKIARKMGLIVREPK